jgi:integrase
VDYEIIGGNPLRGMLKRTHYPSDARSAKPRLRILEPDRFVEAASRLPFRVREMVLVAALTGLRWGELIALRMDEDVDFRRNKLRITRSLYHRNPQTPKTAQSVRDVDLCPTVRRILHGMPRKEGLIFSPEGISPIGDGSWLKRQWRAAQLHAGIRSPITWHDLRHQFVSLLIAAGKHPKYIAAQAGHASAGFTMDRYGSLFETLQSRSVEWWDDLLWHPRGDRVSTGENRHWAEPGGPHPLADPSVATMTKDL